MITYNHNGTEILTSYDDKNIYLFDKLMSCIDYAYRYQSHRNATGFFIFKIFLRPHPYLSLIFLCFLKL